MDVLLHLNPINYRLLSLNNVLIIRIFPHPNDVSREGRCMHIQYNVIYTGDLDHINRFKTSFTTFSRLLSFLTNIYKLFSFIIQQQNEYI